MTSPEGKRNGGGSMAKIIGRRLAQLVPTLFVITLLSFAMMRLAGSDVVAQKMQNTGTVLSAQAAEAAREELGLDRPFWEQYGLWLGGLFRGDMGVSYVSGRDVFAAFTEKLPATLVLMALSLGLTVALSLPLGILAAVKKNRAADVILRIASFLGNSMPNFFVALVLLYLFAIRYPLFPVLSSQGGARGVVLPALTLAIAMSAKYLRQVRTAVLEELGRDYVTGARARGVPFGWTLWRSVLRGCLVQLVTLLTLSMGSLLGGTAIVESIFGWDGVGKLAVDAIGMRDYPMIQAYVMWMALIYVAVNLAADLSYRLLDPRIRLGEDGTI